MDALEVDELHGFLDIAELLSTEDRRQLDFLTREHRVFWNAIEACLWRG